MIDSIKNLFSQDVWWSHLLLISVFFLIAWIIHLLAWRIAGRLVRLSRFANDGQRPSASRMQTMRSIIANTISLVVILIAVILALGQFVTAATLIWVVGLFSAAFGLGARPLISDYLTGLSFIFDDTFAVGDKVEMLSVEGVVEKVNLRTTQLRAPSGELLTIPNGEIRLIRNYSRGRFSIVEVVIKLRTADLARALPLLEDLAQEAMAYLPNLLEPWRVMGEDTAVGQQVELMLRAKAKFGKAAEMRPRLTALVHERLGEAGIELAG
ncbi:MAG: mechanosensitive ion channel family protein [Caldilineales bacterium]|nr:mechanosensitive ion channel family protein [Caldilineales bacterium]